MLIFTTKVATYQPLRQLSASKNFSSMASLGELCFIEQINNMILVALIGVHCIFMVTTTDHYINNPLLQLSETWDISAAAWKRGHISYNTLRLWNNNLIELFIDALCINKIMLPEADILNSLSSDSKMWPLSCAAAEMSHWVITVRGQDPPVLG